MNSGSAKKTTAARMNSMGLQESKKDPEPPGKVQKPISHAQLRHRTRQIQQGKRCSIAYIIVGVVK